MIACQKLLHPLQLILLLQAPARDRGQIGGGGAEEGLPRQGSPARGIQQCMYPCARGEAMGQWHIVPAGEAMKAITRSLRDRKS